jgi:hypothetical protein
MSPFSFSCFKMTITSLNDAERFRLGISIMWVERIISKKRKEKKKNKTNFY